MLILAEILAVALFALAVSRFAPEPWRGRILNVHPALLPRFGGQGMYGRRVHEAVLAAAAAGHPVPISEFAESNP